MTHKPDDDAALEPLVQKAWADFVNCKEDRYFGNRSKLDKQQDVLRRFARDCIAARLQSQDGDAPRDDVTEGALYTREAWENAYNAGFRAGFQQAAGERG